MPAACMVHGRGVATTSCHAGHGPSSNKRRPRQYGRMAKECDPAGMRSAPAATVAVIEEGSKANGKQACTGSLERAGSSGEACGSHDVTAKVTSTEEEKHGDSQARPQSWKPRLSAEELRKMYTPGFAVDKIPDPSEVYEFMTYKDGGIAWSYEPYGFIRDWRKPILTAEQVNSLKGPELDGPPLTWEDWAEYIRSEAD